uniref:Inactive heme oxygenase 2, chloroplastic n=1 Tax=Kalanchoe fedtschenkoi TaxID=63787 RepID=A0A7N1A7Q6_KALFE
MWWLSVTPPSTPLCRGGASAIEKPSVSGLSAHTAFLSRKEKPRFLNVNKKTVNGLRISCSADASPPLQEAANVLNPPVLKKRKRYRKEYPGESQGITEEMRFVAMRLRNIKGKYVDKNRNSEDLDAHSDSDNDGESGESDVKSEDSEVNVDGGTWEPSAEGFMKYLVDSKLVFSTIERIVDVSDDVSYCYFRNTGLERSESLSRDLVWFSQQEIAIPEPSNPGLNYSKYLEELAERSAPLFLSHFYNIYFSHIAGGRVIARQVSEKIFDGKELEFYRWERNVEELLKDVRQKLNTLGEHWSRDDKNRCLKEATKSFRYMGQIVRLIIL